MKVVCVTGGDSKFFLHLLLLLRSFELHCPGQRLHICDFGFTEAEIEYLRERAEVLAMPEELRHVAHAWYRKGAIDLYLKDVVFDAVVWIDADCMLLADVGGELAALSGATGAVVLAGAVFDSFTAVIEENEAAGRSTIALFRDIIDGHGLSYDLPYVNIGLFFCRSRPLLEDWRRATLQVGPHPLFEQNVFNALVHKRGVLRLIDADAFNVTGPELNRLVRRDDGVVVNSKGAPVRMIHLTSSVDGVLEIIELQINIGDKVLAGTMRRPTNPALRAIQHELLQSLAGEAARLDAHGLLGSGGG